MRKTSIVFTLLCCIVLVNTSMAQKVAVLKYSGGGDWYGNPTALPNLVQFCNSQAGTSIDRQTDEISPSDVALFNYPLIHMTGHGNVYFSDEEARNLRNYLISGGFLHIDDNYGMDPYIRKEIKKLFPDKELEELPADHPLFSSKFEFPDGLPKIHEHDGQRPQAFGITWEGRLVLLYTHESDLSDGWESPEVHNDPPEVRIKALKMGANIIKYAFEH